MKILCSGDHHWNSRGARFAECKRVHQWMVDYARENAVDLFISTGDVFDLANSTTEERDAVSDWLIAMAEVCDVLVVDGNHGSAADVELMRKLEARHRIIIETGASVQMFSRLGLAVACVAWPDRANLLRAAEGDAADADLLASTALQNVLRGLGHQLADLGDRPKMLAGHFMVDGSITSTGQPLIGSEMRVSLADLDLVGAEINVMGHIHKAQAWTYGKGEFIYTGSPYRTNYGETEEKSVVLVEFDAVGAWDWKRIPTPAARMFHLSDEWGIDEESGAEGWLAGLHGEPAREELAGAEVRFRYAVTADRRDAARAAAEKVRLYLTDRGAVNVKVEDRVVPVNTARAPEVARAATLADKLSAYWCARNTAPEADRAVRLLDKAHELEVADEV